MISIGGNSRNGTAILRSLFKGTALGGERSYEYYNLNRLKVIYQIRTGFKNSQLKGAAPAAPSRTP